MNLNCLTVAATLLIALNFLKPAHAVQDDTKADGAAENKTDEPEVKTADAEKDAEQTDEEKIHEELGELRDRMVAAYEKRDLEAMIAGVDDDIVITWQNADRNMGTDEFRKFYKEMMEGGNSIVTDVKTDFKVAAPAIIYGDATAIAWGTIDDNFTLRDGRDFTLKSKWTATVAKEDGQWKVVSYHVSASVFDNPMLDVAKSSLVTTASVAAGIGLILGALIVWLIMKRKAQKFAG